MSPRARHPGGLVAAAGALAAILSLWMPWYRLRIPDAIRSSVENLTGNGNNPFGALVHGILRALPDTITGNGWQVMHGGDVGLLIAACGVLAGLHRGEIGGAMLGGLVVAGIAAVHLVNLPGPGQYVSPQFGIWVALLGGVAAMGGAWWANAPAPPRSTSALPPQEPLWPAHEPPAAHLHSVAPPGR